jgi:hypothetical protein
VNEETPGKAYVDGEAKPNMDLAMSIVEHAAAAPADTTQDDP